LVAPLAGAPLDFGPDVREAPPLDPGAQSDSFRETMIPAQPPELGARDAEKSDDILAAQQDIGRAIVRPQAQLVNGLVHDPIESVGRAKCKFSRGSALFAEWGSYDRGRKAFNRRLQPPCVLLGSGNFW
jgi:hypothetical protein